MTKSCKCRLVSKQNQAGFSLLETLVAFAILALVLGVVYQVFGSGSRSARLAHEYAEAVVIAQAKLAEFRATKMPRLSGVIDERYHWALQSTDSNYADPGSQVQYRQNHTLLDLNVIVSWHSAGKERTVELDSTQLAIKE